ncbi:hypothetical protein HA402_005126 [Bradysia odoriphaga]|nr:hypothetical protein HA402_005126 [Bradysia odoriphaga]
MGNSESVSENRQTVLAFHTFSTNYLDGYEIGDRIKFVRKLYSHWALYIGNGRVVHLNPKNCPEMVGLGNRNTWYDGEVTIANLADVAGTDRIRVWQVTSERNGRDHIRPRRDIETIIELALEHQMFKYCLMQFNCEHFVNFLKLGKPVCIQSLANPLSGLEASFRYIGVIPTTKIKTRCTESTSDDQRRQELKEICENVVAYIKENEPREQERTFW